MLLELGDRMAGHPRRAGRTDDAEVIASRARVPLRVGGASRPRALRAAAGGVRLLAGQARVPRAAGPGPRARRRAARRGPLGPRAGAPRRSAAASTPGTAPAPRAPAAPARAIPPP